MEPLSHRGRGHPDRPADRLRHRGDVGGAMGRHHARGRIVRGRPVLVPFPRSGARADRLSAHHPHPSGAGRGADPLLLPRSPGSHRDQQHALRHHARQRGVPGRPAGRHPDPRSPETGRGLSVQGEHRPRRPGADPCRLPGGGGLRHPHDHEQLGRRAAGLDGEHPVGERDLPGKWDPVLPGRLPVRRELLLHQDP